MAPVLNQNPVFNALYAVAIVIGGLVILAILPFLITALYLYITDMWSKIITNRRTYLEWNKVRKEWNKIAAIERRRAYIVTCLLDTKVRKLGLSEEDRFHGAALIQTMYFPARQVLPHVLILGFNALWARVRYKLFKTGYFKNFKLNAEEWNEARARVTGQLDNEMAFFALIFMEFPLQDASTMSTPTGLRSTFASSGGTNSLKQSISPPPYIQNRK